MALRKQKGRCAGGLREECWGIRGRGAEVSLTNREVCSGLGVHQGSLVVWVFTREVLWLGCSPLSCKVPGTMPTLYLKGSLSKDAQS